MSECFLQDASITHRGINQNVKKHLECYTVRKVIKQKKHDLFTHDPAQWLDTIQVLN